MITKVAIVNALTFSRVPLISLWFAFAVAQEYKGGVTLAFIALFFMFLAGISDLFDGWLARRWRVVTSLGKMADPLMDKAFYVMTFPALTWLAAHQSENDIHAISLLLFTILYILRDMWVTFMRSLGAMYGADVSAMWIGKVRTALSFPTAGLVYGYISLHHSLPESWAWFGSVWLGLSYIAEFTMSILNIASFFSYTKFYSPCIKKALAFEAKI